MTSAVRGSRWAELILTHNHTEPCASTLLFGACGCLTNCRLGELLRKLKLKVVPW